MSEFRDSPLSMADVFHVALYKLMISTPTSTAHKPSITRRNGTIVNLGPSFMLKIRAIATFNTYSNVALEIHKHCLW